MGEIEPELQASSISQVSPAGSTGSGKYQLLMELGRGGTAVVYAALARGLGGFSKLVVLKVTRQELGDHPEAVRMFLNEARLSARMNHPNVVQVYEVVEDQGLPVIVMEYLEGQSFATILRNVHRLAVYPTQIAMGVLCKALEGLHYAHTLTDFGGRPLKIIHRDVTPHNIMVTYDGQVKLLDFGIAKLDASAGQTKTGIIKGKLAYMPREQIDGSEMDCRTDIFAIGVMLWEVVAAQRMWGTLSDATVMKSLLCNDIPRLRDAKPDVNPELESIINKAIAPEPEDRYSSAQELLLALTGYLETHGGVATQGEIAQFVNQTCSELKDNAKKRMERELAKVAQSADGGWDDVPAEFTGSGPKARPEPSQNGISQQRAAHDTGTRTGFVGQAEADAALPRRRKGGWRLGMAFVGLAGLAGAAALLLPSAASKPNELAAAPLAAPPAPPAAPAVVRVALAAVPEHAALYLDGVRLATNPFSGSLPHDERDHELRIEADGHVPITRSVRLDRDVEMQLSLERVPAAPAPAIVPEDDATASSGAEKRTKSARRSFRPKRAASPPKPVEPAPVPSAAPAAKPAETNDNCNPPYVVNEFGVKRYKRECVK